jgi:hypothetical protein
MGKFLFKSVITISIYCTSAVAVAPPSVAQSIGRELERPPAHWESVSSVESMDHRVLACMEFGNALIVGGEFNGASGLVLNHIASWDGNQWRPLGEGLDFSVRCLGTYQGRLIAGGDFTASGKRAMSRVAMWNGIEWQPLGDGLDASPTSFVEWNGKLVAGGWFTHSGNDSGFVSELPFAAMWDGREWTSLGQTFDFTALSAPPRDLVVYQGSLYAAGSFTPPTSGTTPLSQPIAAWTESGWIPMGPHMLPDIYSGQGRPAATCFALLDSLLVVGGDFRRLDSLNANGVVAFDGHSWTPLGGGFPIGVWDLEVHEGSLFACGIKLTQIGECVATWDGVAWRGLNIGTTVRALASRNGLLYAAGGSESGEIESWNGTEWLVLGPANPHFSKVPYPVQSLVTYQSQVVLLPWPTWGWNPEPYVPPSVDQIIHHDSQGLGLHEFHGQPVWDYWIPYPSAIFHGTLITGWNTWDGVSAGKLANPPFWYPAALTSWGDSLIAATWPNCGPSSPELWAWNGQSWSPFADGLCPTQIGEWGASTIRVLSPYRNRLIAGGFFSYNDDRANNLAAWNGTGWGPLGDSPNDMVTCLLEYHGDLIAAGFFDHIGSVEASHIARWDGTQWHTFGLGTDGPIYTLAIHNDRVIAGGFFEHAGGLDAGSIAAWDGQGWVPMSTGVDGEVLTMASNQGTLWVGGEFSKAGGLTSFHLAKWVEGPREADFSNFTAQRNGGRAIIQVSASYLPFDHQGFLIYRQPLGEPKVLLTPNRISSDEFSIIDPSPPLGPVTYVIAGVASTGAVTPYASTEIEADPTLRFALLPVRPNPFSAQTTITFHNAKAGQIRVAVFDLRGRLVSDLLDDTLPPGAHTVAWNGRDTSGRSVAAGTYFCRVSGPEGARVERLVRSNP